MRAENEQLRADQEAWAQKAAEEKKKSDAREKVLQDKIDAEKAESDKKLKDVQDRVKRLQAEVAKEEAEKAQFEAEREAQAELGKDDSSKVASLLNDLEVLAQKYSFRSDKNKLMMKSVAALLGKVQKFIIEKT